MRNEAKLLPWLYTSEIWVEVKGLYVNLHNSVCACIHIYMDGWVYVCVCINIKNKAACLKVRYLWRTFSLIKVSLNLPVCVVGKCFFQRRMRSHWVLEMVFSINIFLHRILSPLLQPCQCSFSVIKPTSCTSLYLVVNNLFNLCYF